MPLDPFFTSKVAREDPAKEHVLKRKRLAWYLRKQKLTRYPHNWATKKATQIVGSRHHKNLEYDQMASIAASKVPFVTLSSQQHASISGFKRPKKLWRHRNSQHPT